MAQKNVVAPRLLNAPQEYDQLYMNQLLALFRLYFNQLDNTGPINVTSQRNGTEVISALSFPPVPNTTTPSLPTQADFANLRTGDVYFDTSGGVASSYPLRVKA
jgi:hypothetical protein